MFKRKYLLAWMSALLALCSITVIVMSYRWSRNKEPIVNQPRACRIAVLYSGDNRAFAAELERGMRIMADEMDIYISFEQFASSASALHIEALARAIDAQVDGIITNIPDRVQTGKMIDRAALEGIPIATIVDDIYGSQRRVHIGVDYQQFGERAAQLICEMMPDGARTAIISYPLNRQTGECLNKIRGFSRYMRGKDGYYMGTENVRELNNADAYELTKELLDSSFHYNSFFCLDETITGAVAQCLSDADRSDICVIGCGESQTVYDYLEIGIISALLTENAYSVGRAAVEELAHYIQNGGLPYVVEVDMRVLTRENIDVYYEKTVS